MDAERQGSTTMEAAFAAAGIVSGAARLNVLSDEALAAHPHDAQAAAGHLWAAVAEDAELLRALIGGAHEKLCLQRLRGRRAATAAPEIGRGGQQRADDRMRLAAASDRRGQRKDDTQTSVAPSAAPPAYTRPSAAQRRANRLASATMENAIQRRLRMANGKAWADCGLSELAELQAGAERRRALHETEARKEGVALELIAWSVRQLTLRGFATCAEIPSEEAEAAYGRIVGDDSNWPVRAS